MRCILGIILLVLLHPQVQDSDNNHPKAREIVSEDTNTVVLAIQDEIYDYGYQKEFWGFETSGPRGPEAQFNIYIKPELTPAQGGVEGIVIYKYPPFGEVIRPFVLAPNGTAYLVGNPSNGFPWTQPNTKTIYMNDDEICRDKHDWRKVQFELDLTPTANRVREAVERQKLRVGFSQWESSRKRRK
jgi:hypothetical protein